MKILEELFSLLKNAWHWFLEALFPPRCVVCKAEGAYLCSEHHKFPKAPKSEAHFQFLDDIVAATAYYDPTSEKIVEYFKFRGFQEIAAIMAAEMVKSAPKGFFDSAVLLPIPLYWTRKLWRGFNQAEILAQEIQKLVPGIEILNDLKRSKKTLQQAKLSKKERAENVQNAFSWAGRKIPEKIILIDDVVASGATLDVAAESLKKSRAKAVFALVFARGGKK